MPAQSPSLLKALHFRTLHHDQRSDIYSAARTERLLGVLHNPEATRMLGYIEMKNTPPIMGDEKEAIQSTEPDGRDVEKIHRGYDFAMVA